MLKEYSTLKQCLAEKLAHFSVSPRKFCKRVGSCVRVVLPVPLLDEGRLLDLGHLLLPLGCVEFLVSRLELLLFQHLHLPVGSHLDMHTEAMNVSTAKTNYYIYIF